MILAELERALVEAGFQLRGEARVVVACSGGSDSVCLAHACCEVLGARRVVLAHFDHGVRDDSAEDARLVERLALELGADFSSAHGVGLLPREAELRAARYEALDRIRLASDAALVLTAHTRDDQAETVLMRLIRGARELRGMAAQRDHLLRPLLRVPRAATKAYVADRALPFRDDPSNFEPRYLRNRIRKELLPLLETRYRAGFAARLARPSRREVPSSKSIRATIPATTVLIERIPLDQAVRPKDPSVALIDAGTCPALRVRGARVGDRVALLGLAGHKKLQDIFVDAKVPPERRWGSPVIVDPADEILWVPGLARSAHGLLTDGTREVWRLSIERFSETSTC
ncbi:MAG: tRNA lysidine(34) synthetase TilS [Deltaproteobacteria bacterium]|nr:tRNA lysidine(34) synthetase TilS [Deltaproteobacteria bacterium]